MVVIHDKLENVMGFDSSRTFQFHKSVAAAVRTGGIPSKMHTSTKGRANTSGISRLAFAGSSSETSPDKSAI